MGQGGDGSDSDVAEMGEFDTGTESLPPATAESSDSAAASASDVALENEINQSEGTAAKNTTAEDPFAGTESNQNGQDISGGSPQASQAPSDQKSSVASNGMDDEFKDFEGQMDLNSPPAPEAKPQSPPPEIVQTPIEAPPPEENMNVPVEMPAPVVENAPVENPEPPVSSNKVAEIKNIRYKANDNGGTVVIDGNQPLEFQTRMNADTNQLVIEIQNATLPSNLKRPLNTKDMRGGIGAIDAYQNKGSKVARIVVQMRPGAQEPTVQAEGKSLLVIQQGEVLNASHDGVSLKQQSPVADDEGRSGSMTITRSRGTGGQGGNGRGEGGEGSILSASSLTEFLTGNTQFYGSPMSIDVNEMDVRDVFKLIAEESGVNIVLSDEVKGTVTLKLKDVPWDQIFVIMMKARKLGYTRSGNIIRVATMADIKAEEAETLTMLAARKAQAPLKLKVVPISYADIKKIETDVAKFLSERGKVVGDQRTSSLMITDHDENIERIEKLIKAIDVPPPQVLIEGKIVEASDQFTRQIGVNWNASGQSSVLGRSSNRVIRGRTGIGVTPTASTAINSAANLNFAVGTLDILGDIEATLALYESQSQVKVLSSPRIVTLHNEKAEINQTIAIPLQKISESNGSKTVSVEYKDISLKLVVTPQITNDASVLLDVNVSRSFLGATIDQTTQQKPVNTRSAMTKVMVRNAQTTVIGGVYQTDQAQGEAKVPWLGDIPILGWLFKNRSTESIKNELLIFLTPRILGHSESQINPTDLGGVE